MILLGWYVRFIGLLCCSLESQAFYFLVFPLVNERRNGFGRHEDFLLDKSIQEVYT